MNFFSVASKWLCGKILMNNLNDDMLKRGINTVMTADRAEGKTSSANAIK